MFPIPVPRKYYLEYLPPAIRTHLGKGSVADQVMEYWLYNPSYQIKAGAEVADYAHCLLDIAEIKSWVGDYVLGSARGIGKFSNKTGLPAFATNFATIGHQDSDNFAGMIADQFQQLAADQNVVSFPTPDIPETPGGAGINRDITNSERNDKAWAKRLLDWKINDITDGSISLSTEHPISYVLGRFNWCYLACGKAQRSQSDPQKIQVFVRKIGIFAKDKYDFNNDIAGEGDQFLGYWNLDNPRDPGVSQVAGFFTANGANLIHLTQGPATYRTIGYTKVSNGAFQRYRFLTGWGRDLTLLSNVQYLDVSLDLSVDLRTKKLSR